MNKNNTMESTLNNIKSLCAERERKKQKELRANRLDMERREEAEKERVRNTNSILNSYMDKIRARENQQSHEYSQMVQNICDEIIWRQLDDKHRSHEISAAMKKGIQNAMEEENRKTVDAFMNRNKRLLDKGREAVKRNRNKTYFR